MTRGRGDRRFQRSARERPGRRPGAPAVRITGGLHDRRFDADITHVFFDAATVSRVSFDRTKFLEFSTRESTFWRCDFRKIRSSALSLFSVTPQSIYRECQFDGADLRQFDPGDARFERCTFQGARLDGWRAMTAEFVDCSFGGRLRDVMFAGRPYGVYAGQVKRRANEFRGNDFSRADLVGVDFLMGIDIGAQRWPEGSQYLRLDRMTERLGRARAEVVHWSDLDARRQALVILDMFQRDVETGQEEFFTNRDDVGRDFPAVSRRLWTMLEAGFPSDPADP